MRSEKQNKIDEHNYEYWLKKNTTGQRRRISTRTRSSKKLTTKSMVALALMSSVGVGVI